MFIAFTNLGPYSNLLIQSMIKLCENTEKHIEGIHKTATNMDFTVEIMTI